MVIYVKYIASQKHQVLLNITCTLFCLQCLNNQQSLILYHVNEKGTTKLLFRFPDYLFHLNPKASEAF